MAEERRHPEIDPLATVGIKDVVKRSGIPRSTIMKWLAEVAS